MSASAHEALVRQAIEMIWNRGDLDAADQLFGPGYGNHNGLIADLVLGPEAFKVSAALYRVAFQDCTSPWTRSARSTTPSCSDGLLELPPTGWVAGALRPKSKSLTGTTRSRIAAGKIAESWTEWDRIAVLRELGIPTE